MSCHGSSGPTFVRTDEKPLPELMRRGVGRNPWLSRHGTGAFLFLMENLAHSSCPKSVAWGRQEEGGERPSGTIHPWPRVSGVRKNAAGERRRMLVSKLTRAKDIHPGGCLIIIHLCTFIQHIRLLKSLIFRR